MSPSLTDPASLKALLAAQGIAPRRSASQNFLISQPVIAAIVAAACQGPKQVTELGAGVGVITLALLQADLSVRAIERDQQLAEILAQATAEQVERLEVIMADLREVLWHWDTPYQIIGNIPYQLSGLILRRITQLTPAPEQAILLMQREVGQRLVAAGGQMQLLALARQLWGEAEILRKVPAGSFWPAPAVDSCLVRLTPYPQELLPLAERERVLAIAAHFFRERRKQMGGVLRRWQGIPTEKAGKILNDASIASTARPQEVTAAQWIRFSRAGKMLYSS
ncbi:MAG TPA: rRNA adenine dimethyltransferase family protein [Candidatus Andersenbacteria bacterium]|nr:rRNA adenine dimethyltransferase family protein [Candidatus Andersenbacteria bacterium]